jgi:hypothetical protein
MAAGIDLDEDRGGWQTTVNEWQELDFLERMSLKEDHVASKRASLLR